MGSCLSVRGPCRSRTSTPLEGQGTRAPRARAPSALEKLHQLHPKPERHPDQRRERDVRLPALQAPVLNDAEPDPLRGLLLGELALLAHAPKPPGEPLLLLA